MAKTKTQKTKSKGFAPHEGKKRVKATKKSLSVEERLERELSVIQAELMAEEAYELQERIKGMSSEELERSEDWLYVMPDERCFKGTLDELLDFLSQRTELSLDRDSLREEALKKGGINIDVTGEGLYDAIEFDPDDE